MIEIPALHIFSIYLLFWLTFLVILWFRNELRRRKSYGWSVVKNASISATTAIFPSSPAMPAKMFPAVPAATNSVSSGRPNTSDSRNRIFHYPFRD